MTKKIKTISLRVARRSISSNRKLCVVGRILLSSPGSCALPALPPDTLPPAQLLGDAVGVVTFACIVMPFQPFHLVRVDRGRGLGLPLSVIFVLRERCDRLVVDLTWAKLERWERTR